MRKLSALLLPILALALISSGCGKKDETAQQKTGSLVVLMSQSLQLPAPDNSYAAQNASAVRAAGANVQSLTSNIFDPIASGLKESSFHFAQTVDEGERSNGNLSIAHRTLGTRLTGVANASAGTIGWTYALPAATYFTATVATAGTSGDFTFPASTFSAAFSVHYDLTTGATGVVKHVTIIHPTGNLAFTLTFTSSTTVPSAVAFTGAVSGIAVEGAWTTAAGGSFKNTNGVTKCFNAALADVVCP